MTPRPDTAPRTIWISGVFDIRNYGDALFPLLARHRLEPHGYEVRTVTPAGGACGWAECGPCTPAAALLSGDLSMHGLLIGGGNILYGGIPARALLRSAPSGAAADVADWGAPAIWLAPMLAAALHDVPVAWNAPGTPYPLTDRWRDLAHAAFRASSHVALRDPASVTLAGDPPDVTVVPDTAAALAAMWPLSALDPAFRSLLARKGTRSDARFMAVHLRDRSLAPDTLPTLAAWLDGQSRASGLVPLLVSIGPDLGDSDALAALSRVLGAPHLLLDDPLGPREIAAAIAHSDFYLGASLHGYVTAAAYGRPGLLVARPAHRKYGGFLAHLGRSGDLRRSWDEVMAAPLPGPGPARGIPGDLLARLDGHWASVLAAFADPACHSAQRGEFLRRAVAAGLTDATGPEWLLRPFLHDGPVLTPRQATEGATHD